MPKPIIPTPDEVSKPFWDAVNEKRLIVQNCPFGTRLQSPPQRTCAQCSSAEHLEWRQTSGRGTIDANVVIHDSRLVAWQTEQPYNVAIIQLAEDPTVKFFSNLPGVPADEVPVGAPVEVMFEEAAPGRLIHEWRIVR